MTASKYFMDSSAWLGYFFADKDVKDIVEGETTKMTSVISIFEVKRRLLRDKYTEEEIAELLEFITLNSLIVDLNENISEKAANISVKHKLPAIDALIYTSALHYGALLVTGDPDFEKLDICMI
ncbi:MAG: PIN domain-containing protein [Candidatus Nanoarchaeia archaeon]